MIENTTHPKFTATALTNEIKQMNPKTKFQDELIRVFTTAPRESDIAPARLAELKAEFLARVEGKIAAGAPQRTIGAAGGVLERIRSSLPNLVVGEACDDSPAFALAAAGAADSGDSGHTAEHDTVEAVLLPDGEGTGERVKLVAKLPTPAEDGTILLLMALDHLRAKSDAAYRVALTDCDATFEVTAHGILRGREEKWLTFDARNAPENQRAAVRAFLLACGRQPERPFRFILHRDA
ncbi:MAG: hypothetical protein ABMA01_01785 [Chthoniobacteraceae bacterium]